jgi:hypothetical protein
MSTERLTGRSRLRVAITADGGHMLVVQVEIASNIAPPITRWRDARLEDLSQTDVIPALKVKP